MIKYLTQAEVKKRAKYKIAEIGSVFAPIKKVYGTITNNPYGKRYNTTEVSIMLSPIGRIEARREPLIPATNKRRNVK